MKRATALLALLLFALSTLMLAETVNMTPSPAVPSAQGDLNVEHDSNGNMVVTVHVKHLAQPSSLSPAKSAYIVWLQPQDQPAQPAGVLRVDKDLSGELKTSAPSKRFDVFVTAEDSPTAQQPNGEALLRGTVLPK